MTTDKTIWVCEKHECQQATENQCSYADHEVLSKDCAFVAYIPLSELEKLQTKLDELIRYAFDALMELKEEEVPKTTAVLTVTKRLEKALDEIKGIEHTSHISAWYDEKETE